MEKYLYDLRGKKVIFINDIKFKSHQNDLVLVRLKSIVTKTFLSSFVSLEQNCSRILFIIHQIA